MSPVKSPVIKELESCYHCGDACNSDQVVVDGHRFCCDGCKLVYELLKENELCSYYDISRTPGITRDAAASHTVYSALDEKGVREKLVRFEDENLSRVTFHVPLMHCNSCIWLLEHLNRFNPAIISSTVNFPRREVTVDFKKAGIQLSEIAALMAATGYSPSISLGDLEVKEKKRGFNPRVLKIGVAGFCFANIMMLSFPEYLGGGDFAEVPQLKTYFAWLSLGLSLPVLLYSASDFFISAFKALRHKSLNIDAPIALAVGVTFLRSAYEIISGSGTSYLDSMSGIVFFMLAGRYFQDRTYDSMSFERDYKSYFPIAVSVRNGDKEESIPVTQLKPGHNVIIRSHELIPTDAVLLSERTYIDYSFVTGEAQPVLRVKGDKIFAGARQTEGACELQVLTETSRSYLTQLWNNDAFSRQRQDAHKTYIDRINRWFTSGVLILAFVAACVWFFIDASVAPDVFTAVLIVACPCTLLLASTFTHGSVLRWLGRKKLYLKNASVIERLATADCIVFDKTGTITNSGDVEVRFEGAPLTEAERIAVSNVAGQSGHPLSRRIVATLGKQAAAAVRDVRETSGKGITGETGGHYYTLGSADFAGGIAGERRGPEVWLAIDSKVRGKFIFRNSYRDGLQSLVKDLRKNYRVELLSGDNDAEKETLQPVFGDNLHFSRTPQEKLDHISKLQSGGKKVIMIGDGLNDAGALMQADAGLAVSDNMNNYFPACDGILDGKSFGDLAKLLSFTRVARNVVITSFVISVLYNLAGIYFSVLGELSPLVAAILMPASSFTVIGVTTLSVRFSARRMFRPPI